MSQDSIDPGSLIPIDKADVAVLSPLPADFYMKLTEGNYIIVGRRGDKKLPDLQALKSTDSSELYVRREEYKNCVGANLQIAEIAISSQEISDLKKVDFLFQCSDGVMKEISELGFNHESLEHAKITSKSIITLVSAKDDLNSVLSMLNDQSDQIVKHSMAVSAVSVVIAWHMNWTIQATIQKLALGGLLHDIGLKELPKELISKPRHMMNGADIKDYEAHVMRAVEILSTMPSVPSEVVSIAMEHHENAIGQGYPKHLRDIKMNPFSRVVSVADAFCDLTMKSDMNPNPRTSPEAIKYMELTMGQPFSKPAFTALKQALNVGIDAKVPRKVS